MQKAKVRGFAICIAAIKLQFQEFSLGTME